MPGTKLRLPEDRELLAFVFARFIDGEFTGLKEGYALNYAPDLESADFLAKQIRDEIRHAKMYRRLYASLGITGKVPQGNWLLQTIMAPITGRMWLEHCFLDKAIGERWVLDLMETLIAQVADKRVVTNLKAIARDEKSHIAFGEAQTRIHLGKSRFKRWYLWGLFLRVDFALAIARRLTGRLIRRRYSAAAADLLLDFFVRAREQIAIDAAGILDVAVRRSWLQMIACQAIFLLRLPFAGWFRSPRRTF